LKILILPPYQNKNGYTNLQTRELMDNLVAKGQIAEKEYVIDDGYFIDWRDERRDSEFLANISLGIIKKVKAYRQSGGVDAMVCMGSMEPAFYPAREICDVPYLGALHSALHIASLVGDKCSVVEATDPQAILVRRHAKMYGFNDKLISARHAGFSSTHMGRLLAEVSRDKRAATPEIAEIIGRIVDQCVAAVEDDCADAIILSCMPLQVLENEVRQGFDDRGYEQIPLICELSASVAMAKALVGMGLSHARVAHPRADDRLKPVSR